MKIVSKNSLYNNDFNGIIMKMKVMMKMRIMKVMKMKVATMRIMMKMIFIKNFKNFQINKVSCGISYNCIIK
jgi:hypothetical protein